MTPATSTAAYTSSISRGVHKVLALYKFVSIPRGEIRLLQSEVDKILRSNKARGTILLATEGINGTICYSINSKRHQKESVEQQQQEQQDEDDDPILQYLQSHSYFAGVRTRVSFTDTPVFHRLKVKVKREIVTMLGSGNDDDDDGHDHNKGEEQQSLSQTENAHSSSSSSPVCKKKVNPIQKLGTYVHPGKEWDDLLLDPDVLVIDTRNTYEVEMGTFHNAISPGTDNFRQFPLWLQKVGDLCSGKEIPPTTPMTTDHIHSSNIQHNCRSTHPVPITSIPPRFKGKLPKAVAMFCTGGIRCEKSTSFCLQEEIFPSHIPIYHLEGGILAYLEKHPDEETSLWKGDCFVFDHRVAVTHGLQPSENYDVCFACRHPLSEEDKVKEQDYIPGVCCRYCKDVYTDDDRQRFFNRHKQMLLAKEKGRKHIFDPKEFNDDEKKD